MGFDTSFERSHAPNTKPQATTEELRQNPRVNAMLVALRKVRDNAPTLEAAQSLATIAIEQYVDTAAPVEQSDELVDEVQHRMDQVVEAAVEWHQAGREGAEWFEAAEKLGAAIDSLLELRSEPTRTQ